MYVCVCVSNCRTETPTKPIHKAVVEFRFLPAAAIAVDKLGARTPTLMCAAVRRESCGQLPCVALSHCDIAMLSSLQCLYGRAANMILC